MDLGSRTDDRPQKFQPELSTVSTHETDLDNPDAAMIDRFEDSYFGSSGTNRFDCGNARNSVTTTLQPSLRQRLLWLCLTWTSREAYRNSDLR